MTYLKLIRVDQYVKNLFLFLPLFFSFQLFNFDKLVVVAIGFLSYSLLASSIYILNDIRDVELDRRHPSKKNRPIASGKIPVKRALFVMLLCLSIGLVIAVQLNYSFLGIVIIYIIMNILYSVKLKHYSIIDITIIAIGFVLRIFAGAVLIDNIPSMWIILLTFMLALFLGIAKRRDDILLAAKQDEQVRKNIDGYNLELVNAAMVIMATVTIVSYIMYCTSHEVIVKLKTDKLYITVIFVILGLFRYLQQTLVYQKSESPTKLLLKDFSIKILILCWGLSFLFILYWDKIKALFI